MAKINRIDEAEAFILKITERIKTLDKLVNYRAVTKNLATLKKPKSPIAGIKY